MRLNKVNLCWVLSEGRKGHEIQSMALAQRLANNTTLHTFNLRQPWDSFTPRLIPGFQNGLNWLTSKPEYQHPPDVIISTGRKAAAVGKFVTQKFRKRSVQVKHIQILNPKDRPNNYDLLLVPEHDHKKGINIITFTGSIHPYGPQWFNQSTNPPAAQFNALAVLIGNPPPAYFKQAFRSEIQQIHGMYPQQPLVFCGSPRLSEKITADIKALFKPGDSFWFNQHHGPNPYQDLLAHAKHLFVTADSINMMNECSASLAPITLLAKGFIQRPKHRNFIDSMAHRWQGFTTQTTKPVVPIAYVLDEIIKDTKFQKLLNSPHSSNNG